MGKKPQPNYWTQNRAWYCRINGTLHKLSEAGPREKTKAEAFAKFHRLMADEGKAQVTKEIRVLLAAERFMAFSAQEHAKGTYEQYRIRLTDFCRKFGARNASDIRPSDITAWLAGHPTWSDATRRQAITYVKAMFSWLVKERLLAFNPIATVQRPRMPQRDAMITPEDQTRILESVTEPFRSYLLALVATGARPGEIAAIEARHIDWENGVASLPGKTTRATGKPRRIYLPQRLLDQCRTLAEQYPTGPLFRNSDGQPWTLNAIRCRMRRLPVKAMAYGFRHTWITQALIKGVAPAAVAELAGHSDLKMISNHYSHVAENQRMLRKAAEDAAKALDSETDVH